MCRKTWKLVASTCSHSQKWSISLKKSTNERFLTWTFLHRISSHLADVQNKGNRSCVRIHMGQWCKNYPRTNFLSLVLSPKFMLCSLVTFIRFLQRISFKIKNKYFFLILIHLHCFSLWVILIKWATISFHFKEVRCLCVWDL